MHSRCAKARSWIEHAPDKPDAYRVGALGRCRPEPEAPRTA
jgi:hypothetical protein